MTDTPPSHRACTPAGHVVNRRRRVADAHLAAVLAGTEPLLFDGAMGTQLQAAGLAVGDLPELLNLTDPATVTAIHAAYVAAGAEAITTNTFGANAAKLGDAARVAEVVAAGVACARAAGARYVAADIGPTGALLKPMGTLSFNDAYDLFAEQVTAAAGAGADLFVIETMADLAEAKAAFLAVREHSDLPAFVTMTFDADGRTFLGTTPEVAAVTLSAWGVDALGINCSLGPADVAPLALRMLPYARCPVMVQANAGLPQVVDGVTTYTVTPTEYCAAVAKMVDAGVSVIGGCCGTTPEFTAGEAALLAARARMPVGAQEHAGAGTSADASAACLTSGALSSGGQEKLQGNFDCATSLGREDDQSDGYGARNSTDDTPTSIPDGDTDRHHVAQTTLLGNSVALDHANHADHAHTTVPEAAPATLPVTATFTVASAQQLVELRPGDVGVIGERINPTGKRKLKEALRSGNHDYVMGEAIAQERAGAQILDVNAGLPEIDEQATMLRLVGELAGVTTLPLQIDSSDPAVVEAAVRGYPGKPIINSCNGSDESLATMLPIARHYGCAIVGLTLDENGIPPTAAGRLAIARRIVGAAEELGIPRSDIAIDCLTMAASTDQTAPGQILEAIRLVKHELAGVRSVLGVSNISFGLPARPLVNATFLAAAFAAGLDLAIINPLSAELADVVATWRVLSGEDASAQAYVGAYARWEARGGAASRGGTSPSADNPRAAAPAAGPQGEKRHDESSGAGNAAAGSLEDNIRELVIAGRKDAVAAAVAELLEHERAQAANGDARAGAVDAKGDNPPIGGGAGGSTGTGDASADAKALTGGGTTAGTDVGTNANANTDDRTASHTAAGILAATVSEDADAKGDNTADPAPAANNDTGNAGDHTADPDALVMHVINDVLIPALDEVGERFEAGTFFLPQLMASAEAAKAGFDVLREHGGSADVATKGAIVLATVKGDIHDIGKNIVRMLLENYGYDVIDLGRDVDPQAVVDAVAERNVRLCGLSALMTTTVPAMATTIELLREQTPWCKVVVGGAVLNPEYAEMVGADYYAKDAAATAHIAAEVLEAP